VKDLGPMNRSRKRMVCIDFNKDILPHDQENTIVLSQFTGSGDDKE